jgi:hypothetical protein
MELRNILKTKGLVISRIPQRTKNQFTEIAKAEFCDDYGMCLKWLLDYAITFQPLIERVNKLEKQFAEINKDESKKEKKMLGGNELK